MLKLSQLQPSKLWQFFEHICAIPHPSYHEHALIEWIVNWATQRGLQVELDDVKNIIIRKAATAGFENRQGVILQAHVDMVPQANSDTAHDFTTDPIDAYVDGEWVTARGTTLGADNGIGLASILAVLDSDDVEHGPLEALLTINEEAGMEGAFGLKPGLLEGSILLNTDSEQEGEVYMGCAGGGDTTAVFNMDWEAANSKAQYWALSVKGLKGGHSGCDIHTGRANANKLLARLLASAKALSPALQLASISGGSLRNAIPREAQACFAFDAQQRDALQTGFAALRDAIIAEYGSVETNLQLELSPVDGASKLMSAQSSARLIDAINACENGVIRMSQEIEGVVETSLNLGVIRENEQGEISVQILVRSLVDSARLMLESSLASLFGLAGAQVSHAGAYPGWKPNPESQIKTVIQNTYEQLHGKRPNIMVIHAGLECGLFKAAYPHWDMASFGPTIKFPHSPDEKVNIASVAKYWELMLATLKNIPEKA